MERFARAADAVRALSGKLEKVATLAAYFRTLDDADLAAAARFFTGKPFAAREQLTLSLGGRAVVAAARLVWGFDDEALSAAYRATGDLGSALGMLVRAAARRDAFSRDADARVAVAALPRYCRVEREERRQAPRGDPRTHLSRVRRCLDGGLRREDRYGRLAHRLARRSRIRCDRFRIRSGARGDSTRGDGKRRRRRGGRCREARNARLDRDHVRLADRLHAGVADSVRRRVSRP